VKRHQRGSGGSAIITAGLFSLASVLRCTPENVSPANQERRHAAEDKLLDADLEIREALPDDAHAIAASARAQWTRPLKRSPTVDEMRKRIKTVRDNGLPWLVALWRGHHRRLLLRHLYRPRPAYRYTLEESIYVDPAWADAASAAPCSRG
jgi:hypothetical protein